MSEKLSFSGHEKFHCRNFWLKKGFDFVKQDHQFSDPNAVSHLGVGKNMVSSIRHWIKAFNIVDGDEKPSIFAEYLFGEAGKDPYLEDIASQWLLHYELVKNREKASLYNLVFNQFRKIRIEFNKTQLQTFVKNECDRTESSYNEKTVLFDIGVFLKNYIRPKGKVRSVEDDFTGILIDLNLVKELDKDETGGVAWYKIEDEDRNGIPVEVVLFSILENWKKDTSISFYDLLNAPNSPGMVFCMNSNGLFNKIQELTYKFPGITFKEDAGLRELQIKGKYDKWEVLDGYYGK